MGKGTLNRGNAQTKEQILARIVNSPRLCDFHWWYFAGWGLWLLHPPPLTHPYAPACPVLAEISQPDIFFLALSLSHWFLFLHEPFLPHICLATSSPPRVFSSTVPVFLPLQMGLCWAPPCSVLPSTLCEVPEDTDPVLSPYFQHLV